MMQLSSTKGLSTDIFKWIFGTITGAILLLFFLRFGFQHLDTTEQLGDQRQIHFLNDFLDSLGSTEVSHRDLSLQESTALSFSCDVFGSQTYGRNFNKLVFAPRSVKGDSVHVWTQRWSFPFPIAPLFYLTNDRHRTVVVYDDFTQDLVDELDVPSEFPVQFVKKENFNVKELDASAKGLDSLTVVVVASMDASRLLSQFTVPVTLIAVDPEQSTVSFLNTGQTSFYLGTPLLAGIFFAPQEYPCLLDLSLHRLQNVATVYSHKANLLLQKTIVPVCRDTLFEMAQTLTAFGRARGNEELHATAERLSSQQRTLLQQSCPRVF